MLFLLCISAALQWAFWLYFFRPLARMQFEGEGGDDASFPPLSMVLCARNEAENLRRNLPALLAQRYPANCEVLVVDDRSTDETPAVCKGLKSPQKEVVFRVLRLEGPKPEDSGKKQALAAGIAEARYEHVLLIDADCRPASPLWARLMATPFLRSCDLVLGYSPFVRRPGLLNAFQRFEGLWTAIQYLSFAFRQMPYMGVGRNLAYAKSLYRAVGGFAGHADLPYGDDDLFVQDASNRASLAICLHPQSFVWTETLPNWRAYWRQKRRHLSASNRYKRRDQVLLAVLSSGLVLHVGLGYLLLPFYPWWAGGALLFRYVLVWPLALRLSRKLGQADLGRYWPFYELLLVLYLLFMAVVLPWNRRSPTGWRGEFRRGEGN